MGGGIFLSLMAWGFTIHGPLLGLLQPPVSYSIPITFIPEPLLSSSTRWAQRGQTACSLMPSSLEPAVPLQAAGSAQHQHEALGGPTVH